LELAQENLGRFYAFAQIRYQEYQMSSSSQVSRVFSLELFPAKTEEGFARLKNSVSELLALQPEFFSVTFGAGGSTRDRTFEVARE
jgi:methylenetetrahydrofolate reductase (NADPH)